MKTINNKLLFKFAKILFALIFLCFVTPAYSEYMYVDENGNTVWGHEPTPGGDDEPEVVTPTDEDPPEEDPPEDDPPPDDDEDDEDDDTDDTDDDDDDDDTTDDTNTSNNTPDDDDDDNGNIIHNGTNETESTDTIKNRQLKEKADELELIINENIEKNDEEIIADTTQIEVIKIKDKITPVKNELITLDSDSQTQEFLNEEEINNLTNISNEPAAGDPVKLASGTYEQNDTDISCGNEIKLKITRHYSSDNKIISSYGQGWFTNLDQRIIFGIQAGISQLKEKSDSYLTQVLDCINQLELLIINSYKVSSLENAQNELLLKIERCDQNLSETQFLYNELTELEEEAEGYEVQTQISELKLEAQELCNSIETKKTVLQKDLENLKNDLIYLDELKTEYQAALDNQKSVNATHELSISRKQKNEKTMFTGMNASYEETGLDTITIIDEDGYPHLMYETFNNSGIWKTKELSEYFECEKSDQGFILKNRDGTQKLFDSDGFLIKLIDRNGNFILLTRNANKKVVQIENSFGEKFSILYDGSFISLIQNQREKTQTVSYGYQGNFLSSVTDTDGDTITMEYDQTGHMTHLHKCDQSTIIISYNLQAKGGKLFVTGTTDEEQFTEAFDYNENTTTYTDHDNNKTIYEYDQKHRIKRIAKPDGTLIKYEYTAAGQLLSIDQNGSSTTYSYDQNGNKTYASYSDDSYENWSYNNFGQIITYRDRDNIYYEYLRDEKGNLKEYKIDGTTIFVQQVNSNGQITERTDYGQKPYKTSITYDSFGNIKTSTTGQNITEYFYDELNRIKLIKLNYIPVREYSYQRRNIVQSDYNKLETTYIINGRKDLTEIIQKDCISKIIHKMRIEYDRRHLPQKIYSGDGTIEALIASYFYTKEQKLQAQVSAGEPNYVKLYEYQNGRVSKINQFTTTSTVTQENLFSLLQAAGDQVISIKYDYRQMPVNGQLITLTDSLNYSSFFEYDAFGNLVKTTDANGDTRGLLYSGTGLLTAEQSSFGGWYEYKYKNGNLSSNAEENAKAINIQYYPDGSIKQVTDRYDKTSVYNYDDNGQLSNIQSENQKIWYEYDSLGRIKKQAVGSAPAVDDCIYYVNFEYGNFNRSVIATQGGKYETVYELDAFGNVTKQTDGNGNSKQFEYNCKNQLINEYDGYENKTSYEYNALGSVSCIVLPDGAVTKYSYNYMGLVQKITDDCGTVYAASYDKAGRLISEQTRGDSKKSYFYDNAGRVKKVLCGGEIIEEYTYSEQGRSLTIKDGNGFDYHYSYDYYGRLVSEQNRLGITQDYLYDEDGILKSQNNFDGTTTTISFSKDRTVQTVHYSDGTQNSFIYDAIGNIVEAQNAYGKTLYEYDKGGRLITQKDVTVNEQITFEYDQAGNRTGIFSSNRATRYTYGKNNEIKEIFDNKQRVSVQLQYDKNGREVLRKNGNGTKDQTLYDKAGRVIVKTQKSEQGTLLWGEGYIYNDDGKRAATVDNNARVTLYEYDNQGRLSAVYYPYTQEMIKHLESQALENGLTAVTEPGQNKYLSSAQKEDLVYVMNLMQHGLSYNLSNLQIFIKESYSYDKNGNRISKTTPYGTINYSYDKENRLISSGSRGKVYVSYSYDNMGNLLSEESAGKVTRYTYNSQNRIIYCEVTNTEEQSFIQTRYAYDAFGRRILVQDYDEPALRNLYDGFSFDVIKQNPTYDNGTFTDSYETGIRWSTLGQPTGDRYRYLGSSDQVSGRYQGEQTWFSINDSVIAQFSSTAGLEYLATDFLGSVRTTTDEYGSQKSTISYDAFGSLVQGDNLTTTTPLYTGKPYDPTTRFYNYGYRDYSPTLSRFTTPDPIRDGPNWFSYCNSDPINFVDLWGLCMSDKSLITAGKTQGELDPSRTTDAYQYIKNSVELNDLMGKKYSTDSDNIYVCTTFVREALDLAGYDPDTYLPGGQMVVNSVNILGDKLITPSEGKNPSEGTYVFYHVDNDNEHGHTGIIHFDAKGNASILHNGKKEGEDYQCVNERTRTSERGSFDSWFREKNNPVKYLQVGD